MSCKPLCLHKGRTMSILPCTWNRFVVLFCLCLVLVSSSSQCHLPVVMVVWWSIAHLPLQSSCTDAEVAAFHNPSWRVEISSRYSREKAQTLQSLSTKEQHSTAQHKRQRIKKGKHVENFRTYGTTPTTKSSTFCYSVASRIKNGRSRLWANQKQMPLLWIEHSASRILLLRTTRRTEVDFSLALSQMS